MRWESLLGVRLLAKLRTRTWSCGSASGHCHTLPALTSLSDKEIKYESGRRESQSHAKCASGIKIPFF